MDFLTVEQVAASLGLSEKTVRKYINTGELKAFKLGTSWKITKDDLQTFIQTKSNIQNGEN